MTPGDDWLDQARRLVAGLGQTLAAGSTPQAGTGGEADAAAHGGDCRWCPLCQVVGVLRGERPELTAALADALSSAAAALRTLAEPPQAPAESTTQAPAESTTQAPAESTTQAPAESTPEEQAADGVDRPAVQHIEIA
jgi:hypothetical protein